MCCGPSGFGSGPAVKFAERELRETTQMFPAVAPGFASAT